MVNEQPINNDEKELEQTKYSIDYRQAEDIGRALNVVVAGKRCYLCQSADEESPSKSLKFTEYIKQIVRHCRNTQDYLPPNTPLKEALFRILLSQRNRPATPLELSKMLGEIWATAPNPRDIAPVTIKKVLDFGGSYCIVKADKSQ